MDREDQNKVYAQFVLGGGGRGGGGLNNYSTKCESGYYSFIGLHYNQTSQ